MADSVPGSTFFLTLLLAIGLFFFIRASFKDRTTTRRFLSPEPESALLTQLQQYFDARAYQVTAIDAEQGQIQLAGRVKPSVFLAIFLSVLAAVGLFCLDLLVAFSAPEYWRWSLFSLAIAPGAGVIYWNRAGRTETVEFNVSPPPAAGCQDASTQAPRGSCLTVTAHRDELIQLKRSLPLTLVDAEP